MGMSSIVDHCASTSHQIDETMSVIISKVPLSLGPSMEFPLEEDSKKLNVKTSFSAESISSFMFMSELLMAQMNEMKQTNGEGFNIIKAGIDAHNELLSEIVNRITHIGADVIRLKRITSTHQRQDRFRPRLHKRTMDILDPVDELDTDQWETVVSVHSPVVRTCPNDNCYTTYSISLKSNNSCFSQPFSCVQRRYSEFARLRHLLKESHPNVMPPPLPPKKLFRCFDQSFIEERTEGLQYFLKNVLNIPVYLSNKSIHLFLQTENTMYDIEQQLIGHCPAVPKMHVCDSCSDTSSEPADNTAALTDLEELTADLDIRLDEAVDEVGTEAMDLIPDSPTTEHIPVKRKSFSQPIPILQPYLRSMSRSATNSLNTTPIRLSPVCSSADSGLTASRRVSFCEKVKVAVVKDQFWNIGTRPIRTCAW